MIIAAAFLIAFPVVAQEKPDSLTSAEMLDEIGQDTDPTKPIFISLRDEFTMLKNNTSINALIVRFDRLVLEGLGVSGPARGILVWFNFPIVTSSNPSSSERGLGDIYMQALVAP